MAKTDRKVVVRKKESAAFEKISGTSAKPRLRVFKSNRHIYAQIIDDTKQVTLASMSTKDKEFDSGGVNGKINKANIVGETLARRAKDVGIEKVVFDRGGYIYHGRVKALAEGARKGGLDFDYSGN